MKEMVQYIDQAAIEVVKAPSIVEISRTLTRLSLMFPIKRTIKGLSHPVDPVSRLMIFRMGVLQDMQDLEPARSITSDLLMEIRQEELQEGE